MSTTTNRTPRTIKSDRMFYLFALGALRQIRARDEAWREDADRWAREGYRPRTCKHGTYMWVDWDCVCAACEESLSPHEEALMWASHDSARMQKVIDLVSPVLAARGTLTAPDYVNDALTRWLVNLMPDAVYPR